MLKYKGNVFLYGERFGGGAQKIRTNGRYTAEEYYKLTHKFVKENGAEVFVGVFDGEPEISFKVKTIEQAERLAVKYNQKSFWKNAEFEEWDNLHYDVKGNLMRGD